MPVFLVKAFAGTFGGGWIVYAVIAGLIFAGGSASGYVARGYIDAPIISDEKAKTADAKAVASENKALYDKLVAKYDAAGAETSRALAEKDAAAADQARADANTITKLQSQLTAEQTAHARTSANLTAELNHAASSDDRELGPASIRFFNGLRQRQASAGNGSSSDPGSSP